MSEYWKSTPKYWCKHCSTYVKDTPLERKQHESTGKHQGNLRRFLRGIQNDHERNEREKQKAKAEVERLNRVVGNASSPTGSTKLPTNKPSLPSQSVADQKRQWAQLAEMGISVPEEARREVAMAGDWQVISQQKMEEPSLDESLNVGVRKRKLDAQDQDDEDEQQGTRASVGRRGWGSTTRQYPTQDAKDLDELFSSNIPLKVEKGDREQSHDQRPLKAISDSSVTHAPEENSTNQVPPTIPDSDDQGEPHKTEIESHVKPEPLDGSAIDNADDYLVPQQSIPMFKKRKAKGVNR